jgi:IS5 family transposase
MKRSISVVDSWSTIERMSWNIYNEGCDLVREIERYRDRYGYYPESVHADKIYRTLAN